MLEKLVSQARRRLLLNDALAQTAFAAAVTAGGLVLLLVLGTRWLEWWPIALFAAVGGGIGIYRLRRHLPDPYTTAIRLDRNAHLQDALSTAIYFSQTAPVAKNADRFRKAQHEYAEKAAQSVALESAIPFVFPKALYAMAALGLVCSGLVALRYRVGRGLDLRSPITEVLFDDQEMHQPKKLAALNQTRQTSWAEEAQQMFSKLGITPATDGPSPSDPDALNDAIQQALQQPDKGDAKNEKGGSGAEKAAQGKDGTTGDQASSGDPIDGADKKTGDQKDADAKNANSQAADSSKQGDSAKDGDSSSPRESLFEKLKDAMSNLLSKSQPEQKQQQSQGNPQQQAKNEQRKSGKKGDNSQGTPEKSNSESESDSDPNGDAMGGQQGQGKQTTASNQHQAQEGSGIGAQDGLKDLREAEQLKAMGKISEIIGKRSATVTGETSVEVQSGDQRLHTSYSNTNATHAETDGDVTRDEIPLALQAYVQQYFEEVHKTAPKKAAAKTANSQ